MQILDGKKVSARIKEEVAKEALALREKGIRPGLAVILAGNDPASRVYVNNKKKACEACNIYSEEYTFPETVTESELLELIDHLNRSDKIHGILVQLPLPAPCFLCWISMRHRFFVKTPQNCRKGQFFSRKRRCFSEDCY